MRMPYQQGPIAYNRTLASLKWDRTRQSIMQQATSLQAGEPIMKIHAGIVSGLIILAIISLTGICAAEETAPDTNTIGPGNPLYGLRIAFEDLDESFTFNATERVEKKLKHANNHLYEYQWEWQYNNTDAAERALYQYHNKVNQTENEIGPFKSNETGLLHAQEMIVKHQQVLAGLLQRNPNSTGLARAYNNSLRLEEKFEEKTRMRYERFVGGDNSTRLNPVPLGDDRGRGMKNGNGQPDNAGQGPAANQTQAGPGQGSENRPEQGNGKGPDNQTGQGQGSQGNSQNGMNTPRQTPGPGSQDQNGQGAGQGQNAPDGGQQNPGQGGQNQNGQDRQNPGQQPGNAGGPKK